MTDHECSGGSCPTSLLQVQPQRHPQGNPLCPQALVAGGAPPFGSSQVGKDTEPTVFFRSLRWDQPIPCFPTAASTPALAVSTASRCLGLAVACLTGKSCPGPAVGCNGAAKSPVGGGLAAALCRIWPASAAPAMPLSYSSLTYGPQKLFLPCLRSDSARSCRSGGMAGVPFPTLMGLYAILPRGIAERPMDDKKVVTHGSRESGWTRNRMDQK